MISFYGWKCWARLAGLLVLLVGGCLSSSAQQVIPKHDSATTGHKPDPDPGSTCVGIDLVLDQQGCSQADLLASSWDGCTLTYKLILNGQVVQTQVGQNVFFTVTTDGTYTVTAVAQGNTLTSAPVTVSGLIPRPTVTASGPLSFCPGGYVDLTSSAGTAYSWSTGETTQSIRVTSSGTYWVYTSSGSVCGNVSASVVVTVNPLPDVTVTPSGSTTFCAGSTRVLSVPSVSGTTYQWRLFGADISGATGASYTVTASGSYSVYAQSAAGCSAVSAPLTMTATPMPQLTISTTPASAPDYNYLYGSSDHGRRLCANAIGNGSG